MNLFFESHAKAICILAAVLTGCLSAGCRQVAPYAVNRPNSMPPQPPEQGALRGKPEQTGDLRQVSAVETAEKSAALALPELSRLAPTTELSVEALIEQVLARNPSLAEMTAAWQAASARYPQAVSLEDPMFGAIFGPGTIASPNVNFAYRLEASQKYPWPGKLGLRGQAASAEANAAGHDVDDVRVQLIEAARQAFYEYFLVGRFLVVNEEALRLLQEFRKNAADRYQTGLVPQQDVLQADVEIARQRERQLLLERMNTVAIARINTLMNLPTATPMPPPPKSLQPDGDLPALESLQAAAVANRPDLQALANRIAADQALLALAFKEYRPDFEVMAMWDKFMGNQMTEMAPMVGFRMNVPVRRSRRHAAVAEAQAEVARRSAELAKQTNQVNLQVQEAYSQVRESEKVVQLYKDVTIPAAEANVKAAQSAYVTGKIPFLSLIEAERSLINLRDRANEALADLFRRRATLERAVGGPPPQ